jgi:hypothetical protein
MQYSTSNISKASNSMKRKRVGTFLQTLHDMLDDADENEKGFQHILSWLPDGKGFRIHDEEDILPLLKLYFNQTKFKSFLRQLQHYSFARVIKGPKRGVCSHKDFVRGQRNMCLLMARNQDFSAVPLSVMLRSKSLPTKLPSSSKSDQCNNNNTLNETHNTATLVRRSSGLLISDANSAEQVRVLSPSLVEEDCDEDFFAGRRFFHV